jgi:hypothetical protein
MPCLVAHSGLTSCNHVPAVCRYKMCWQEGYIKHLTHFNETSSGSKASASGELHRQYIELYAVTTVYQ